MRVRGQQIELAPPGPHLIGRHSEARVAVDHELVSRRHAQLTVLDGDWVLEDLGSANGSFTGGRRTARLEIVDPEGVEVMLGDADDGVGLYLQPVTATATAAIRARETMFVGDGDQLPSGVDAGGGLGRMIRAHADEADVITVGRADDNSIVLNDLTASRHHAELHRRSDGGLTLRDLGGHNGTFVDGERVTEHDCGPGDVITIGSRLLRIGDGRIEEYSATEHFPVAAVDLTVTTPEGVELLSEVSFSLGESSMMAVLGPSGAGKSTLLGALTGLRPATSGRVFCGGLDLYTHYEGLRRRIGYVPQDDLVQPELTVAQSIDYAARLRFSPDVSASERDARVQEVIGELGLAHRAGVRVGALSGGQRKRVSMALELLTKPSLLFLDEPTSGLDPGYERSVMALLRRLADGGRTVILVTHSVESLHMCDRILCLAPGGRTAWFGPPEETAAYFEKPTYQEIFQLLDTHGAQDHATPTSERDTAEIDVQPVDWKARYLTSSAARRYVTEPLEAFDRAAVTDTPAEVAPEPAGGWFRQLTTLTSRYARVVVSDRRTLTILAVTAPVLGLVLLLRLPPDQLAGPGSGILLFSQAPLVVFIVAMGITQVGTSTAVREIVKEREILRREKSIGLSVSAYVLSKMLVLGALALVQAAIIVLIATARQGGPADGLVLGSGRLELVVIGALTGLGAMAAGLLVSAIVGSPDRVALILPAVLGFHLIVTSGEVMPAAPRIPVVEEMRYLSTARWGFAGMASTADIEDIAVTNRLAGEATDLTLEDVRAAKRTEDLTVLAPPMADDLRHERSAWYRSVVALVGLITVMMVATVLVLRRLGSTA